MIRLLTATALTATALAASVALSGCASVDPETGERDYNKTAIGAAIGAAAGAAAGVAAGGDDGRNAAVGAVVGAVAGAAVGRYMDEQERKLREQTRSAGVAVTRQGDEITLTMPNDITFGVDRADLNAAAVETLARIADTLKAYPRTTIDVIGHADSTGSDGYNMALSQRRAGSVAAYLASQGVQMERIVSTGRGESQPTASNDTPEGRARNRRVEIKLRPVVATG